MRCYPIERDSGYQKRWDDDGAVVGMEVISCSVTSSGPRRTSPTLRSGANFRMQWAHFRKRRNVEFLFWVLRNIEMSDGFTSFKEEGKKTPALSIIPDHLDLKLAGTAQSDLSSLQRLWGPTVSPASWCPCPCAVFPLQCGLRLWIASKAWNTKEMVACPS